MTVEMKKYKLGNIADFDKKTLSKKDSMDVIEYLDTGSLTENIFGPMQVLSRQDAPSRAQRRVFDKTILYSTVRPRLKHYGFMEKPKENTIVSTGFVTIDVKDEYKNVIDPYYLYLLLIQDKITEYLGTIADTAVSSYPSLNPSDIQMLEFEFPDLSIQKKIASVLYNIDKRVVNLRTQNRVLEQTAKTIYDYTFLQCAGHQTTYNKTLNRNIPTNWEVKNMSELAEVVNGATPSTAEEGNFDGGIVWITPKDLSDQKSKFVYFGERTISQKGYDSCSTTLVPVNSILMSSRAPIGLVSIAKCELCTNQGFKTFVPKSDDYTEYLYYYLLTNMKKIEQLGSGTTFKEVSRGSLTSFPVIVPDKKTLDAFNSSIKPLFEKQLVNTKQIEALTTQRNTLLPLLMTGQIEV